MTCGCNQKVLFLSLSEPFPSTKKEKREDTCLKWYFFCSFDSLSYTKSIEIFWICIHRDWRDSNPQLPPWQGGALTNWTTIPGKKSYSIHQYCYNFIQTLCFSIWDSRTPVKEADFYIDSYFSGSALYRHGWLAIRSLLPTWLKNQSRKQKRLFFLFWLEPFP